ncbi:MAG: sulfotransferase [Methylocella sp.]
MADPLFILAPGRTFTSVISGMIGQHPEMYGFPELYLNHSDTLRGWWVQCGGRRPETILHNGLLRTVAEFFFGEQTDETVAEAKVWIRTRFDWETSTAFHELTDRVAPRIAVEKSPFSVRSYKNLERLRIFFPDARFIHLVRHPRPTCASLLKFDRAANLLGTVAKGYDFSTNPPTLDPQLWWYECHMRIKRFTEELPATHWIRLRGEEFLKEPRGHLRLVAEWLGLRSDDAAIEEMMHPERSPFAHFGPPSAKYGNDPAFLESPEFRPFHDKSESLDNSLSWRPDGRGFRLDVRELAREFGYQ